MRKAVIFAVLAAAVIGIIVGAYLLKFQKKTAEEVKEEPAAKLSTEKTAAEKAAPAEEAQLPAQKSGIISFCVSCHGEVKGFHYPAITRAIDIAKGVNPRTCISCHGQKVHEIHKKKLDASVILCDTCHKMGDEISKPKAEKGMLLVCELCHAKGNYIGIHIEGNILKDAPLEEKWIKSYALDNDCSVCHFGEYSFIHANAIGRWREKIDNISRLDEIEPLNISYL